MPTPLLADERAAQTWFLLVSPVYDALAGTTIWPPELQAAAVDRLRVEAGDRVLDVGCGTGATTVVLRERTTAVEAVDLSREQLDRARRRPGLADVGFVRGDATWLPFPDAAFDSVASVGAVLYWGEPSTVIGEAYRVTRPGGRLLLAGFNRRPRVRTPIAAWASVCFEAAFTTYDAEEATELCRGAGYREVDSRVTGPAWHPTLVVETFAIRPE